MSTIDPAISVVVPVRNEAGNIAPLAAEIARALDGQWLFEVVYVNDGSTDGTDAELARLMAQHRWLRRVTHRQSCGQSSAVRSGVAAARAPLVVTLDGDGQNDPAFIPALVTLEWKRVDENERAYLRRERALMLSVSQREMDVVELLPTDMTYSEIGNKLGIKR